MAVRKSGPHASQIGSAPRYLKVSIRPMPAAHGLNHTAGAGEASISACGVSAPKTRPRSVGITLRRPEITPFDLLSICLV